MTCKCQTVRTAKRLPPGAHADVAGIRWCAACWHERYILRAVTIPVAGPVDGTWPELREALKTVFRATTRLRNWAVTELAKADVVRLPEMKKLPKPPRVYLYPGAREVAPEIDSGSTVAILHAVEGRWCKRRFNVVWLGNESLPNYRYDRAVYPVRSQDWKAVRGEDGEAMVSVRLAGRRWLLRLRGGHQFHRQLAAHAKMVDGLAVISELSLSEERANGGDHRPQGTGRDGGGNAMATRLMCKMVAWLPREAATERAGTLFVTSDPAAGALLVAVDAKQNRLWVLHANHVARWMAEHSRRLASWSDDAKLEARRGRRSFASRREAACQKQHRRMETACKQMAAQVVGYAIRRRFAAVQWVEPAERRLPQFCWAALLDRIAVKCGEVGISFRKGDRDGGDSPQAE